MKKCASIVAFALMALMAVSGSAFAQRPQRTKPVTKAVVFKHKKNHSKRVVVYHPYWAPRMAFYRRWVYFPRLNIYWDNLRGLYVYRNGTVWVTSVSIPAVIVNVDLSKEKHFELPEENDAVDEVYQSNQQHSKLTDD